MRVGLATPPAILSKGPWYYTKASIYLTKYQVHDNSFVIRHGFEIRVSDVHMERYT